MSDLEKLSDRELDALVAEKVFRVPFEPYAKILTSMPAKTILETPFYSTDIAAAWTVVEKIAGTLEPHEFTLAGSSGDWTAGWTDGLSERDDHGWVVAVCASTAPRAICLAALEAVEK